MTIQPFKGYTGLVTLVRIDDTQYFILANTESELAAIHNLLALDREFDPGACKPAILINPDLFPPCNS